MLLDSVYIQESEIEWKNRKRKREGKELLLLFYILEDVENVLKYFRGVRYGQKI